MQKVKNLPTDDLPARLCSKDTIVQSEAILQISLLTETDRTALMPIMGKLVDLLSDKEEKVYFYAYRALSALVNQKELADRKEASEKMAPLLLEQWLSGTKGKEAAERACSILNMISEKSPSALLPYAKQIADKVNESLQHAEMGCMLLGRLAIAEPGNEDVSRQVVSLLTHSLGTPVNRQYQYHYFATKILRPLLRASEEDKRLESYLAVLTPVLKETLEKYVSEGDPRATRAMDAFFICATTQRRDLVPAGVKGLALKAADFKDEGVRLSANTLLNALKE